MEPVIQALSKKYQEEMTFLIIDVGKQGDPSVRGLGQKFQVQSIPAMILIDKKGQVVNKYAGVVGEEALTKDIEEIIRTVD